MIWINPKAFLQTSVIALLVVWLLIAVPALGDYELSRRTIDGGGESSGGDYIVIGTIGRSEAGVMSGGDYELLGGFWPGEPLCAVDFYHFARFAEHWLDTPCNAENNWCGGADLNQEDNIANYLDMDLFVDEWLYYCPRGWPLK